MGTELISAEESGQFGPKAASVTPLARLLRGFAFTTRRPRAHSFSPSPCPPCPPKAAPKVSPRKSAAWGISWVKSSSSSRARRPSILRKNCACWPKAASSRAGDAEADRDLRATVQELTCAEASRMAMAFTVYFELVNLAEETHRVRLLRQRRRAQYTVAGTPPMRESIGAALRELKAKNVPAEKSAGAARQALHRARLHRAPDRGQAPHHADQAPAPGPAAAQSRGLHRGQGHRHRQPARAGAGGHLALAHRPLAHQPPRGHRRGAHRPLVFRHHALGNRPAFAG